MRWTIEGITTNPSNYDEYLTIHLSAPTDRDDIALFGAVCIGLDMLQVIASAIAAAKKTNDMKCKHCGSDEWCMRSCGRAPDCIEYYRCNRCGRAWQVGSDDDMPITREWVNEVYPSQLADVIDVIGNLKLFWDGSLFQLFIEDNYGDRPGVELPHIKTRGPLRQLLAALKGQVT